MGVVREEGNGTVERTLWWEGWGCCHSWTAGLPAQDLRLARAQSQPCMSHRSAPWVGEGLVYSSTDDLSSHEETAMLLEEVMGGPELNTWLTRLWSSLGPWGTVNKDRLSVALVIPKLFMCLTWAGGLGQGVPVPLPCRLLTS